MMRVWPLPAAKSSSVIPQGKPSVRSALCSLCSFSSMPRLPSATAMDVICATWNPSSVSHAFAHLSTHAFACVRIAAPPPPATGESSGSLTEGLEVIMTRNMGRKPEKNNRSISPYWYLRTMSSKEFTSGSLEWAVSSL